VGAVGPEGGLGGRRPVDDHDERLADVRVAEQVEEGTGGTFSNCTGFTAGSTVFDGTAAAFGTSKTDFATGVGTWAPNGGNATKTYKVTYTLSATTPDSAQGGSAALGFTWESQNS